MFLRAPWLCRVAFVTTLTAVALLPSVWGFYAPVVLPGELGGEAAVSGGAVRGSHEARGLWGLAAPLKKGTWGLEQDRDALMREARRLVGEEEMVFAQAGCGLEGGQEYCLEVGTSNRSAASPLGGLISRGGNGSSRGLRQGEGPPGTDFGSGQSLGYKEPGRGRS